MRRVMWTMMVLAAAAGIAALPCASFAQEDSSSSPPTAVANPAGPEVERTYRTTCEVGGRDVVCEVRLTVSKAAATVADRIEMVLEARVPDGVKVEWPKIEKSLGGLDVLGVEDEAPVAVGRGDSGAPKRELVRRVVLLEPFLPGEREIPQLEAKFSGAGACRIVTEPVRVEVTSLIEGEPKEPELRGVVEPKPETTAWWVWAAAGAGTVLLAGVVFAALRMGGKKLAPPLTPYGAAMKRLEEIEEEGMLAEGKTSEYGAALGETLRVYVSGAMGLRAGDRTTEQLLVELGSQPSVNIASLQELLGRLDEVSFAGASVSVGEAQELRDRVHKMIVGMQAVRAAAEADVMKGGAS
jgi:hypothetical protein